MNKEIKRFKDLKEGQKFIFTKLYERVTAIKKKDMGFNCIIIKVNTKEANKPIWLPSDYIVEVI